MRKILFTFIGFCLAINLIFAGGLVTNTNQSAAWARMLVRDASTTIEAAYHNPAGLTKLSDGFHLSLSNQSIFQNRTITNSFQYLNDAEFEGSVVAPLFPNFYAAYKTGKFAFSFGFTPIGGGGSAVFERGVPMIEVPVSSLKPNFAAQGVNGYSLVTNFEGSSVYFGVQGGISYEINDMISVYAGARYVWAKNTYEGEVKDVSVITATTTQRADVFMNNLATQLTALAGAGAAMDPLVASPLAGLTFDQAIAATAAQPATQAQISALKAGLIGLGQTNAGSMTLNQGNQYYDAASPALKVQATKVAAGAILMGDQTADVTQTGNGFTPIIGVNLSFLEDKINIGMKYEFITKMDLTNETPAGQGFIIGLDPTGKPIEMFPNGEVTNADMPAMLSVGVNYKFTDKISTQIGYHTYFDKKTGWENVETEIDKNFWELGLGLEYNITDQLLISGGILMAKTGVNETYQSDLSYSLPSTTFGLGGAYKINDKLMLQLGGYYTAYQSKTFDGSYTLANGNTEAYTTKYEKTNMAFAIGMDFTFGGK